MKITLFLLALCLAVSLVSALRSRTDKRDVLVNRPRIGVFGPRDQPRDKRAPWPWARTWDGVKGGVKGQRPEPAPPSALEGKVRKGEYVCGNKICKLEPGVEPAGCNGVCQYPIL